VNGDGRVVDCQDAAEATGLALARQMLEIGFFELGE